MAKVKEIINYKDYLNSIKKEDLNYILSIFDISYNSKLKKDGLISIIIENMSTMIKSALSLFQNDELMYLKQIIKKKGTVIVKNNYLFLNFIKNMIKWGFVVEIKDNTFCIPQEILTIFKNLIKNKKTIITINNNTKEYNLLLGMIDAYGVIEFNYVFETFNKYNKYEKNDLESRITKLQAFYEEFNIFINKTKKYICNKRFDTLKSCNKLIKIKDSYNEYLPKELINIHTFKYMYNFKSYKKLMKYVDRNYYLENNTYKVFNKYVLAPFLIEYQNNKENSKAILSDLIDKHFEFNNNKHKAKFISLVENIALDYPKWELKGKSEREVQCLSQKI